jgi:parallel beta-helix repeat protein
MLIWGAGAAAALTVSCGQVINSSTTVSNDLTNCPGPGLVIGADNITLDLNGHTIDGDGGSEARDIGVANGIVYSTGSGVFEEPAHSGVTVRNGAIREFGFAGANSGFDPSFAEPLATGNVFSNLHLTNANLHLLYTDDSRVEGNTLSGGGIHVAGSSRNNVVGNTVVGGGVSVTAFEVRGGRGANDNVVSRNTVRDSRRNGVYIGHGLPGSWPNPSGTRVLGNAVSGSVQDGIHSAVFHPDFPETGALGTVLDGNRSTGNGDDGIDVDSPSTTIGASTANSNTDLGIEAVAGTTDAGGNHAQGNGNPAQCTNVSCDTSTLILFGRRVAGGFFSAMSANAKRASPFTLYLPVTVRKFSAYLDGRGATTGSQVMRAVIYRHSSGAPGELVARSFQATITAGRGPRWVDFYLPFPPRLQPGVYWLGIHSGATHGVGRFAWDPVPNTRRFNIDSYADGPSNPFGSAALDNQQMSIFASGSY